MRISDWSSDVCSSDLSVSLSGAPDDQCRETGRLRHDDAHRLHQAQAPPQPRRLHESLAGKAWPDASCVRLFPAASAKLNAARDRKSVGEGKSVSGRGDLGGRRTIRKKTRNRYTTTE